MKKLLYSFLILAAYLHVSAQCELEIDYSQLTMVYGDEFNNPSMPNHIAKWDSGYYWGGTIGNPTWHYAPAYTCIRDNTHSISNDMLNLKIVTSNPPIPNSPGNPQLYNPTRTYPNYYVSSSLVRSKYNEVIAGNTSTTGFRYGVIEIRCQMPATAGLYPCIWLCGSNDAAYAMAVREGYSPNDDFMSYAQYPTVCPWGTTSSCGKNAQFPYDLDNKFHTYHLVWTPDKISWFFDGREYLSMPSPAEYSVNSCSNPYFKMDLIFDIEYIYWCTQNGVLQGCENTNFLPQNHDPVKIDYIRIYKPTSGNWSNFTYKKGGYHGNTSNTGATTVANQTLSSNFYDHVWYKGNDSRLWNIYWASNQWNSTPLSWSAPADVLSDVYYDNGNNRAYYRNSSNQLKWFSWNGSSYVLNYDGVVNNISGWLDMDQALHKVFYRGTDGTVWNYYNNGSGYIKNPLGYNYNVSGWIEVSPDGTNVFYRGDDGYLWRYYWNGTSWVNQKIAIANNVSGYLSAESNNRVYYRGTDGRVWNWDGIGNYIAPLTWDTGLDNCNGYIVSNNNGIFYKGNDSRLWHFYWEHDRWYYEAVNWNSQTVDGFITTNPGGQLFYIGTPSGGSNTIYEAHAGTCNTFTTTACNTVANMGYYKTDEIISQQPALQEDQGEKISSSLFPNPTSEDVTLKMDAGKGEEVTFSVYDYTGKVVIPVTTQAIQSSGTHEISLGTSALSSGVYIVRVKVGGQSLVHKFTKL